MSKSRLKKLSIAETNVINFIAQGMSATAAVKKAFPLIKSDKYAKTKASRLVAKDYINGAIEGKKAEITEKNNITLANLQNKLFKMADEIITAKDRPNYNKAINAINSLLKTIGGFQSDSPSDKTLELKRLDAKQMEDWSKIAQLYYADKYGPKQIESHEVG